jgi:hypothetical protein
MPSMRTARKLAALWESLRPIAIGLSILLALFVDVVIARALWGSLHPALTVLICIVAFIPMMIGIYTLLSLPVNALIGMARVEED